MASKGFVRVIAPYAERSPVDHVPFANLTLQSKLLSFPVTVPPPDKTTMDRTKCAALYAFAPWQASFHGIRNICRPGRAALQPPLHN